MMTTIASCPKFTYHTCIFDTSLGGVNAMCNSSTSYLLIGYLWTSQNHEKCHRGECQNLRCCYFEMPDQILALQIFIQLSQAIFFCLPNHRLHQNNWTYNVKKKSSQNLNLILNNESLSLNIRHGSWAGTFTVFAPVWCAKTFGIIG